jgi:ribosome-associated protein
MASKRIDPDKQKLHAVVELLRDKKAENITVLDMGELSAIADYFIIATATSEPHLTALRGALENLWREKFSTPEHKVRLDCDARAGSGWFVLDAGFGLIHLFTAKQREHYRLEDLWGDAKPLPLDSAKPPRKKAPAKSSRSTSKKAPSRSASTRKK